jgi:hypothetical protein
MPDGTELTALDMFILKGKEQKLILNATPRLN